MKIQRYFTSASLWESTEGKIVKYDDYEAEMDQAKKDLKTKMEQAMRIIRKQKKEIDGLRFFKQVFNMPIEEVNKLLSRYDR